MITHLTIPSHNTIWSPVVRTLSIGIRKCMDAFDARLSRYLDPGSMWRRGALLTLSYHPWLN